MTIDNDKIKFTFYFEGNKYIVFSLKEDIEFGDDLFFAKYQNGGYESLGSAEYEKVLKEYQDYLNSVNGGEMDAN